MRRIIAIGGFVFAFFCTLLLIAWFIGNTSIDQAKVPLFIAVLSSLFSLTGVIASTLVVVEMRKDRDALYKPDILADFEDEEGVFTFVVQNAGLTAAKKVRIEIDPLPHGQENEPLENVVWLQKPIETLLPGKKLMKVCNVSHTYFSNGSPLKYTIKVTYSSLTGKQYIDGPYQIDLEEYRNSTIPVNSAKISLVHIADHLKKIADK